MALPHREGGERRVGRERLGRALSAVHRVGGRAQAGVRVGEAQLIVDLIEDEDELRAAASETSVVSSNQTQIMSDSFNLCATPMRAKDQDALELAAT